MAILTADELLSLVREHGALPGADRVAAACALVESGGNTEAVGDNGHSIGLWQMHDQGAGAGMSVAEREDPDSAADVMVPIFNHNYQIALEQGRTGEDAARYTAMYTERPFGFPNLESSAADHYIDAWRQVPETAAAPVPTGGLAYDQDTSSERQIADWVCSIRSTCWALRSVGFDVTAGQLQDAMVDAGLVSVRDGLLDGSGASLAAWIRNTYGVPVEQWQGPTWEQIRSLAGRGPILLGSTAWYHWCDVRANDGDALWLNNPAPGYPPPGYRAGIGDTMDHAAWNAIAPDAVIRIPVEAAVAPEPPATVYPPGVDPDIIDWLTEAQRIIDQVRYNERQPDGTVSAAAWSELGAASDYVGMSLARLGG